MQSQVIVTVDVTDVNDNNPQFKESSHSVSVTENTGKSAKILTVYASDIDVGENGRVSYRIKSGDSTTFAVNPTSGEITTLINLDREMKDAYKLTIEAYDYGKPPRSSTSDVTIAVSDLNDNNPVIDPAAFINALNESIQINSKVAAIAATDKDFGVNSELTYSLRDTEVFRIDASNGDMYLAKSLDRETKENYTIYVEVSDKGKPILDVEKSFVLNVLDANDNSPEFTEKNYKGTYNVFV